MEIQTVQDTNGFWDSEFYKNVTCGCLKSGGCELWFRHPGELRELIEAAEHLLTKMEGEDDGE